jgi:hypothetical protein
MKMLFMEVLNVKGLRIFMLSFRYWTSLLSFMRCVSYLCRNFILSYITLIVYVLPTISGSFSIICFSVQKVDWIPRYFYNALLLPSYVTYCHCVVSQVPCPFHPPWFIHPNNIWWGIQIMKLFITTGNCYLLLFRPSASCSRTPSAYTLSLIWENKFRHQYV